MFVAVVCRGCHYFAGVHPRHRPALSAHPPFFYSVIPASEPGSWAALCEVLHCAVALPSSSSPPPRVRLRANWVAVRQSVQARLRSPCTNCPHQVRDDGAIAPLYHCLRHCHPRQRLPGCRLGGRHDGAVATIGDAARNVSTMRRLCCWHRWRRCTQRLYHAPVATPRPDVAVRWIARPRLIRRPAGQRRARPKFILFEAVGKFMNFSVRRASMSG